mgnify:CR=1 FL=1
MDPINYLFNELDIHHVWEDEIQLKRYEYLKRDGQLDSDLYYVKSGALRIFIKEEEEEMDIRFGYSGNLIAALDCFITDQPSDLIIQSIRKTELQRISKSRYLEFIHSKPEYLEIWDTILQGLILQQMERERDLLTSSPMERYLRVKDRSPQLFQEIPNKYIASYLRMTPETLSRLKKS